MTARPFNSFKNQKGYSSQQAGFTLIELLVVIGILAILLAITLIAINPAHQFAQANNTKRRSDILQVLNAIGQYSAENKGLLPTEITTTNLQLSSGTALTTLCAKLSPTYIPSLPTNPSLNSADVTDCAAASWATGYYIVKDANNRVTVSANPTDESAVISVTR